MIWRSRKSTPADEHEAVVVRDHLCARTRQFNAGTEARTTDDLFLHDAQ